MLGLVVAVVGGGGYGWAPSFGFILLFLVLHAGEGFVHPMLSALISHKVPDDAQGELQGEISSIMSISMLLGTLVFSQIFGYFMSGKAGFVSPNVAMYVSAGISFIAALFFVGGTVRAKDGLSLATLQNQSSKLTNVTGFATKLTPEVVFRVRLI